MLATPSGAKFSIHPSEPNYLWAEAGTNFGIRNDNDPSPRNNRDVPSVFPNNFDTPLHLSNLLTMAGHTWKSYQEDVDLAPTGAGTVNHPASSNGGLTNVVLPQNAWTVPLVSFSGTFAARGLNAFNRKNQYNYAAKHNPQVFFTDTNGGNNPTNANPLSLNHAPLQQLAVDLASNTVADYNWITPNQFNDMHTAVSGTYVALDGTSLTGDPAKIRAGRRFSRADHPADHGVTGVPEPRHHYHLDGRDRRRRLGRHAVPERLPAHAERDRHLSRCARQRDRSEQPARSIRQSGRVYALLRPANDQEIFGVGTAIRDAANANDLSDLFKPGVISNPSVKGNLTISAGQSMTFSRRVVTGNIKVNGGTLFLSNGAQVERQHRGIGGNVSIANSTVAATCSSTAAAASRLAPARSSRKPADSESAGEREPLDRVRRERERQRGIPQQCRAGGVRRPGREQGLGRLRQCDWREHADLRQHRAGSALQQHGEEASAVRAERSITGAGTPPIPQDQCEAF